MKKVIVEFGLENINIMVANVSGKRIKVDDHLQLDTKNYLNDSGTLNSKKIAVDIRNKLLKNVKMNMDIVLPTYMTNDYYLETDKVSEFKEDDNLGKAGKKKVMFIGDNGNYNMSHIVTYNNQDFKGFVNDLYKEKLNVVSAISNYSAIENVVPFISGSEPEEASYSLRVMVLVGTNSINCLVMDNNMPLYMKDAGFSLYDLYRNVKEHGEKISFKDFINAFKHTDSNDLIISQEPEAYVSAANNTEEAIYERENDKFMADMFDESIYESTDESSEPEDEETSSKDDSGIKSEICTLMDMLCKEIKDVIDYVHGAYGNRNVEIVTNSNTVRKFISNQLSGIYQVFNIDKLEDEFEIGDINVDLSAVNNPNMNMLGCLGDLICNIKKGAEFYE